LVLPMHSASSPRRPNNWHARLEQIPFHWIVFSVCWHPTEFSNPEMALGRIHRSLDCCETATLSRFALGRA
jgi:hypothetical protein